MVVTIKNEKYRTLLVSLPIAFALVVLFAFVLPCDYEGMGTTVDYSIPPETSISDFVPVFGILAFVFCLVWLAQIDFRRKWRYH